MYSARLVLPSLTVIPGENPGPQPCPQPPAGLIWISQASTQYEAPVLTLLPLPCVAPTHWWRRLVLTALFSLPRSLFENPRDNADDYVSHVLGLGLWDTFPEDHTDAFKTHGFDFSTLAKLGVIKLPP
ncbi:unnamed protein product [Rhizoctonia solani]|nr:unnamed protein product [Rhizoctonia solani]